MNRNKRGIDYVDLTDNDQENAHRPNKVGRNDRSNALVNASNGQRFGEDTAFVPLSQSSQSRRIDDDDAGAVDLVRGSQDSDDNDVNDFELYGVSGRIRIVSIHPR